MAAGGYDVRTSQREGGGTWLSAVRRRTCPRCSADIDHDESFVPWCAECDWNVEPPSRGERRPSVGGRLGIRLGQAAAERLARELSGVDQLRPPPIRLSLIAALAIAGLVLAISVGLALLGLRLVVAGGGFWPIVGIVLLVVAVVGHPRLAPRPSGVLARESAPELYRLVDELSSRVQAPRVTSIAVNGDWNAASLRYGLRQRHALVLGLPLWRSLAADERVALVTHEIAHGVNGDTSRITPVAVAQGTLLYWAYVLEPDQLFPTESFGVAALLALPINLVLLGLSAAMILLAMVLAVLTRHDGQRAEYYADALAASVAGSDATVRVLDRLLDAGAWDRAVSTTAIARRPFGLWAELDRQRERTPASELERLRRAARRRGTRLGDGHPPLPLRIELLRSRPTVEPTFAIDDVRMAAIDAELEPLAEPLARATLEAYREALGAG